MLAFRPAFDEKERNRLIKQVTARSRPGSAKLNPEVPRDLETIVQKAIEREPRAAMPRPRTLADDLQRFVDDEPIKARRISRLDAWPGGLGTIRGGNFVGGDRLAGDDGTCGPGDRPGAFSRAGPGANRVGGRSRRGRQPRPSRRRYRPRQPDVNWLSR